MKQELFPEIADSGLRIDKYLSSVNEQLSRSYIQKLLKSGLVLVDGKPVKASYQVDEGDVISLDIPEAVEPEIEPENMDLDILYEDQDVILVNQPKGMVVTSRCRSLFPHISKWSDASLQRSAFRDQWCNASRHRPSY